MPGARCARSRVCDGRKRKAHALVRSHRNHPAFPARWFTAYSALSPVTGLSCHRRYAGFASQRNLMPASGHQDHTTSPSASKAPSSEAPLASTASRLTSVTIAKRPSCRGETGEFVKVICPTAKAENFSRRDWTAQIRLKCLGKLRCRRRRFFTASGPRIRSVARKMFV
jgi:hypothetical protein